MPNCDNQLELLPIVDEAGNVTGKISRRECHNGSRILHPVVHLHLFDTSGRIYLQKRPEWKTIQPGKWDTAVGGHIEFGETVDDALLREAREEINVDARQARKIHAYVFESPVEREYIHVHMMTTDTPPCPSDELEGGAFWNIEEVLAPANRTLFTPNFISEFTEVVLPAINLLSE